MAKKTKKIDHSLNGVFDDLDSFALNPLAAKPVVSTDVLVGAAIGVVGQQLVAKAFKKFAPASLQTNQLVGNVLFYGGGAIAGLVAYFAQRNQNHGRATGHFIGALAATSVVAATNVVSTKIPGLSDLVEIQMNDYGLAVQDPRFSALIEEPAQLQAYNDMAAMAAMSMNEDEDDGLADLIEINV